MAVTIADLLEAIHVEDNAANRTAVTRIQGAVTALVEKFAPGAEGVVKDLAVMRCVGYIQEAPASAPARMNFANAMEHSGANAMLAPWREHGAGVF